MKSQHTTRSIIVAAALLGAAAAHAQYTVQFGGLYLDPGATASNTTGALTPTNALSLNVKPVSTVFFSVGREINADWDLQLSLGYPPTHDITLKVTNASALPPSVASQDGNKIGTVRQIAPTLFANYKFGDTASAFRPFIGIGINYTMFDQPTSNSLNNSINGGTTNAKLSDSWGLAAQVGATYKLSGPWTLNAAISTADVNTTLTTNTDGVERKTNIKFSPAAYILSVGYKF
jgi:outer membrane protein